MSDSAGVGDLRQGERASEIPFDYPKSRVNEHNQPVLHCSLWARIVFKSDGSGLTEIAVYCLLCRTADAVVLIAPKIEFCTVHDAIGQDQ
jgi:hypothetical protein